MAVSFPSNPTVGQTVSDPDTGATWVWNGTAWVAQAGAGPMVPLAGGTMTGPLALVGVTDGSNAAPGIVGEVITASNTSISVTAQTWTIILSMQLTPGDWDVYGYGAFSGAAGSPNQQFGITTGAGAVQPNYPVGSFIPGNASDIGNMVSAWPIRVNVTVSTQVNLCAYNNAATSGGTGLLRARRMR